MIGLYSNPSIVAKLNLKKKVFTKGTKLPVSYQKVVVFSPVFFCCGCELLLAFSSYWISYMASFLVLCLLKRWWGWSAWPTWTKLYYRLHFLKLQRRSPHGGPDGSAVAVPLGTSQQISSWRSQRMMMAWLLRQAEMMLRLRVEAHWTLFRSPHIFGHKNSCKAVYTVQLLI